MKKLFLIMISFTGLSYANAYTLNLPENVTYINKNCKLEVGKKTYVRSKHQGHPSYMEQDALLTTKTKSYKITLEDHKDSTSQTEFGRAETKGEYFPVTAYVTKIDEGSLALKLIAEDSWGRTDVRVDCGVMVELGTSQATSRDQSSFPWSIE